MSIYFINTSSLYLKKNVEYQLSAFIYNSSSINDLSKNAEIRFYMTNSYEGGKLPFDYLNLSSFGKLVSIFSTTMSAVPRNSSVFVSENFICDTDGTASILINPVSGTWMFSEVSIKPFQTDNFNAAEFDLIIPNPSGRNESVGLKANFIDGGGRVIGDIYKQFDNRYTSLNTSSLPLNNGNDEQLHISSLFKIVTSSNTVISNNDNIIEGSLYVSKKLYGGIHISGENNAMVRSVGYTGYTSASEGKGGPGFIIFSGSVLPNTVESGRRISYGGVGLELHAGYDSGSFRFRADSTGSFIEIKTKEFLFGNPASAYISGSNGILVISSSAFYLNDSGTLIISGNITASAGSIGGFNITSHALVGNNFYLSGAAAATGFFISSSKFNVKGNGDISGSNVLFTGGKVGGWALSTSSISSSNLILDSNGTIKTSNYVSNQSGWMLTSAGNGFLEVETALIRGTLKTVVFEKETVNAVGGQLWIANSTTITGSVAASSTTMSVANASGFKVGEILLIKKTGDTGFSSEYVLVNNVISSSTSTGSLHITRAYSSGSLISAPFNFTASNSQSYTDGQVVVSTGISSSGWIRLNANPNDVTTPYIDIIQRTGSGVYDYKVKARLGNLSGLPASYTLGNTSPGFGLASENVFLTGGIVANFGKIANWEITASTLTSSNVILDSANSLFKLGVSPSLSSAGIFLSGSGEFNFQYDSSNYLRRSGTVFSIASNTFELYTSTLSASSARGGIISLGATPPTSINSGTGILLSGSGQILIGAASGFGLKFDGTNLNVSSSTFFLGTSATYISGSGTKIKISGSNVSIQTSDFDLYASTISASSDRGGIISLGATPPTSINSGTGILLSGSGQVLIGAATGYGIKFDGTNLNVSSSAFFLGSSNAHISGAGTNIKISGSNITISTDTFLFGNSGSVGSAYISGSGGKLEISSSGFYLSRDGTAVFSGSITASAGNIGGFNINRNSLYSTGIIISGSPVVGGINSPQYMFISTSNLNIKQNGDISGSGIFFNGGKLGGWTIGNDSISGSNLILKSDGTLYTSNYASNLSGWKLSSEGNGFLEVETALIRGTLKTVVFEKETINAIGGQVWIANATTITGSLSANSTTMSVANASGFKTGEILLLKKTGDTGFSSEYVRVNSIITSSNSDDTGSLYVTRAYSSGSISTDFNLTSSNSQSYTDGQVIVSTGVSGSGWIRLNANPNDSTTPYIDVVERTGSGVYDFVLQARLGDLSGLAGTSYVLGNSSPGFGLASRNVFLTGGITATFGKIANWEITSSTLTSSGVILNSGNGGRISLGVTPPTSINSGTGILLSGSGQVLIGAATGYGLKFDGTNLNISSSTFLFGTGTARISGSGTSISISGSNITIISPSFLLGNPNTSYISGSNGTIFISSSGFDLSTSNLKFISSPTASIQILDSTSTVRVGLYESTASFNPDIYVNLYTSSNTNYSSSEYLNGTTWSPSYQGNAVTASFGNSGSTSAGTTLNNWIRFSSATTGHTGNANRAILTSSKFNIPAGATITLTFDFLNDEYLGFSPFNSAQSLYPNITASISSGSISLAQSSIARSSGYSQNIQMIVSKYFTSSINNADIKFTIVFPTMSNAGGNFTPTASYINNLSLTQNYAFTKLSPDQQIIYISSDRYINAQRESLNIKADRITVANITSSGVATFSSLTGDNITVTNLTVVGTQSNSGPIETANPIFILNNSAVSLPTYAGIEVYASASSTPAFVYNNNRWKIGDRTSGTVGSQTGVFTLYDIAKLTDNISFSAGNLIYIANSTDATNGKLSNLAIGSNGNTLNVTNGLPSWTSNITASNVSASTTILANNITSSGIFRSLNATNATNFNVGAVVLDGGLAVSKSVYISGSMTILGDLTLIGTASQLTISSSTIDIGDNIIRVNAVAPYKRYAGFEALDSGSSPVVSSSLLWDSQNDYWLISSGSGSGIKGSKIIGTTANSFGSEESLTVNTIPKATHTSTIGDSLLIDNGIRLSYSSGKFSVDTTGAVTASSNVSSSGNIFGNNAKFIGSITASSNVSSSGNIFGNNAKFIGSITASSDISSSGNITASNILLSNNSTIDGGNIFSNSDTFNFATSSATINIGAYTSSIIAGTLGIISSPGPSTVRTISIQSTAHISSSYSRGGLFWNARFSTNGTWSFGGGTNNEGGGLLWDNTMNTLYYIIKPNSGGSADAKSHNEFIDYAVFKIVRTGNTWISGTLDVNKNLIVSGDLTIDGANLTTDTNTTFNIGNTVPVTMTIGDSVTSMTIGATTGKITFRNASALFNGSITSSGIISSSNNIIANNARFAGSVTASSNISSSGNIFGNNAKFIGNVTASGDISASGEITASDLMLSGNAKVGGGIISTNVDSFLLAVSATTMSIGANYSGSISSGVFSRILSPATGVKQYGVSIQSVANAASNFARGGLLWNANYSMDGTWSFGDVGANDGGGIIWNSGMSTMYYIVKPSTGNTKASMSHAEFLDLAKFKITSAGNTWTSGSLDVRTNLIVSGNITVDGASLTTATNTLFNIANSVPNTITFGDAANSITIGATTGKITFRNPSAYFEGSITASSGISASGNIFGNNAKFIGSITASSNISSSANIFGNNGIYSGNITASGVISASGNIFGNNAKFIGSVTASSNISASGNILSTDAVFSGNVTSSGNISASGFVSASNINLSGVIVTNGTGTNLFNGAVSINGNTSIGNNITDSHVLTGSMGVSGSITIAGNVVPASDGVFYLGQSSPSKRWADIYSVQTTTGGVFESGLRTLDIGVNETGTIVSWKDGKLVPCFKEEDENVIGVIKNGKDEPLILGAEPILITGKINSGDFIVTSNKPGHGKSAKLYLYKTWFKRNLTGKIIGQSLESAEGNSVLVKAYITKM